MSVTTTTDTASIIEKRVSEITTQTLIQQAVMLGAIRDFTAQVGPGMDRLDIPLYAELPLQDVPENALMTSEVISVQTAKLLLDQHKSLVFSISDRASVQSKANLIDETVRNGAQTHAANIDDYILAGITANTDAANIIAADANDALADLANLKKVLDDNNVPKQDRFVVCNPEFISKMLKTNTIVDASSYGNSAPIQAGFVSRVMGFTVLESSSSEFPVAVGGQAVAFHRSCHAFARQIQPKFESERVIKGQRFDFALTQLFGSISADSSGLRSAYLS